MQNIISIYTTTSLYSISDKWSQTVILPPQGGRDSLCADYQLALRYRRIITDNTRLQQKLDNLLIAIIHRGYKHDNNITSFNKALLYTQNDLLNKTGNANGTANKPIFSTNTIVIHNTLHKYYVNTGTSLKMILHCKLYSQNLQL